MASIITKNICNDLNRLATINLVTYGFDTYLGKKPNLQGWKDGFLRDIIILMVYHQSLYFISTHFEGPDSEMVDDFVKTGCLLLAPGLISQTPASLQTIGTVLGGVVIYHKLLRPTLVHKMQERGVDFNAGIEDLVETVFLLSMTRDNGLTFESIMTQLSAIAVSHAYLRF
jgi:hypothetical protein